MVTGCDNQHIHLTRTVSGKPDCLVLPKTSRFTENLQNRLVFGLNRGQEPMTEQGLHKTEARFGLSMPKTSITTFCLTMLTDLNFS